MLHGIPASISPELLFAIARMGHGDFLVIADANFPSDSISKSTTVGEVIRVFGISTSDLLKDLLKLLPPDQYLDKPIKMMDLVDSDKGKNLKVAAYEQVVKAASLKSTQDIDLVERFKFYDLAKQSFVVIQTDDCKPYANIALYKGVLSKP